MAAADPGLALRQDRRYGAYSLRTAVLTVTKKGVRVARPTVHTRPATQDDLPILLDLWDELRQAGGRAERALNPISAVDARSRLVELLNDPRGRVVLACCNDVPVGMAIMRLDRPDPLSENELVYIPHLAVSRSCRHQGVGHALVAAATEYAAALHVDHIAVGVYPSLRETNRFFARLGFAPASVHRIAPVSVLRRQLGRDRTAPMLGDAVRRRTRLARPAPAQRVRRTVTERVES
jgi:GNAT superfamily N-acetyltransferase